MRTFMKKFLILAGVLVLAGFGNLAISADDAISEAINAEITAETGLNFNDNKVAIGIQKHPATDSAQNMVSKNNWFCIIIQYVGTPKLLEQTAEQSTEQTAE